MSPNFHNEKATKLAPQYLSKSFEEVHESWAQCLPSIIKNPNARILDVGAGGDTKHLAELAAKTHHVYADKLTQLATDVERFTQLETRKKKANLVVSPIKQEVQQIM